MARQGNWKGRQNSAALAALVVVQAVAGAFFIGDALTDLRATPTSAHALIEAAVALALIVGVVIGGWQLRLTLERMHQQQEALDTARGDLARVVSDQFEKWRLTPAERDVGHLALKGLNVADIASIRNAAPGTVRTQLTRIYAKAGVSGRAEFAAWFVEDLLNGPLPPE